MSVLGMAHVLFIKHDISYCLINSLWSLYLDSQHGTTKNWAKYICGNILHNVTPALTFKIVDPYGIFLPL